MPDEDVSAESRAKAHETPESGTAGLKERIEKFNDPDDQDGNGWRGLISDLIKYVLRAAIVAFFGYFLTDRVSQALREREIQLEAVREVDKLAPLLEAGNPDRAIAKANAAPLAAFGRYSVPFFVNTLEVGTEYGQAGAEEGLRMVARSESGPVCSALTAIIKNKSGLYKWQTHLTALKILGQVGCVEAQEDVANYLATMSPLANFQPWVSAPIPQEDDYKTVKTQASQTLNTLNLISQNGCSSR